MLRSWMTFSDRELELTQADMPARVAASLYRLFAVGDSLSSQACSSLQDMIVREITNLSTFYYMINSEWE